MSLWAKITAGLAVLLTAAVAVIKILIGRNKQLQHENELQDKEIEIREGQEKVKSEIEADEKQRIEKTDRTGSRADRLNRL